MKNKAKANWRHFVYLASAISALGGMLFGYDIGVISGAILFIKTDSFFLRTWRKSSSARFCWDRSSVRRSEEFWPTAFNSIMGRTTAIRHRPGH